MDGKSLKKKIQQLGISQVDLARLLNVTPQSMTAVFSAKDVKTGTIEKIAQVLNISPVYFYEEETFKRAESRINSSFQTINEGSNNTQIIHKDNCETSSLKQRITDLEQIIYEKERLISVLMKEKE